MGLFLIVLFWKALKYFMIKGTGEHKRLGKVLWIIAEREVDTEYLSPAHSDTL